MQNIQKLIAFIFASKFECTEGEGYRTAEQAWINALPVGSKLYAIDTNGLERDYPLPVGGRGIAKSLHSMRLAQDINLYKDGNYISNSESYKPFGDFWESLDPANKWGGKFRDGNHFEMTP